MAAYIDLNPVRAGIVKIAEDYRWCGYGAAVGGCKTARAGLGRILENAHPVCGEDFEGDWTETHKLYRLWMYSEGVEVSADPETGQAGRKGFTHEELEVVERLEGKLPIQKALRCRVRYLTDGAVFGAANYVEQVFVNHRSQFGAKRESGARAMRGAEWGGLCVIRDLRRAVMGR